MSPVDEWTLKAKALLWPADFQSCRGERLTGTMLTLVTLCSVKLEQSIIWVVSTVWLWLPLHVPGDIEGHGQWRCTGEEGCGRGADFRWVRLQAHLLVVVQLADDDAAEVFIVSVTVVQELAHLGGARWLVYHQFVILAHQHGAGQQGIQALVQTGLCHLGDDLLPPCRNPLSNWAFWGRGVPQGRRVIGWKRGGKGDWL